MYKSWSRMLAVLAALLLLPSIALAAGGGGTAIVIVADTRGMTGLLGWWGSLYNYSHGWFTAMTVVLIPIIGVIFGVLADFVMAHIGIDLKSRELAEH